MDDIVRDILEDIGDNELKHYLLSTKELDNVDYNLTYNIDSKEKSFIALSSTLIPCSILLNYYLNNKHQFSFLKKNKVSDLKHS